MPNTFAPVASAWPRSPWELHQQHQLPYHPQQASSRLHHSNKKCFNVKNDASSANRSSSSSSNRQITNPSSSSTSSTRTTMTIVERWHDWETIRRQQSNNALRRCQYQFQAWQELIAEESLPELRDAAWLIYAMGEAHEHVANILSQSDNEGNGVRRSKSKRNHDTDSDVEDDLDSEIPRSNHRPLREIEDAIFQLESDCTGPSTTTTTTTTTATSAATTTTTATQMHLPDISSPNDAFDAKVLDLTLNEQQPVKHSEDQASMIDNELNRRDSSHSSSASSPSDPDTLIGILQEAEAATRAEFAQSATLLKDEIANHKLNRLIHTLEGMMQQLTDQAPPLMLAMEQAESEIQKVWDEYFRAVNRINRFGVYAEMISVGLGFGTSNSNHNSDTVSKAQQIGPSDPDLLKHASDVWLLELSYRMALYWQGAALQEAYNKLQALFKAVLAVEVIRRLKFRDALYRVMKQQYLVIHASAGQRDAEFLTSLTGTETDRNSIQEDLLASIEERLSQHYIRNNMIRDEGLTLMLPMHSCTASAQDLPKARPDPGRLNDQRDDDNDEADFRLEEASAFAQAQLQFAAEEADHDPSKHSQQPYTLEWSTPTSLLESDYLFYATVMELFDEHTELQKPTYFCSREDTSLLRPEDDGSSLVLAVITTDRWLHLLELPRLVSSTGDDEHVNGHITNGEEWIRTAITTPQAALEHLMIRTCLPVAPNSSSSSSTMSSSLVMGLVMPLCKLKLSDYSVEMSQKDLAVEVYKVHPVPELDDCTTCPNGRLEDHNRIFLRLASPRDQISFISAFHGSLTNWDN